MQAHYNSLLPSFERSIGAIRGLQHRLLPLPAFAHLPWMEQQGRKLNRSTVIVAHPGGGRYHDMPSKVEGLQAFDLWQPDAFKPDAGSVHVRHHLRWFPWP